MFDLVRMTRTSDVIFSKYFEKMTSLRTSHSYHRNNVRDPFCTPVLDRVVGILGVPQTSCLFLLFGLLHQICLPVSRFVHHNLWFFFLSPEIVVSLDPVLCVTRCCVSRTAELTLQECWVRAK